MTDFEYDALQKKRIGRGYHNMKRRTRGCTLPSDRLTATQLKARNGPVSTYNLSLPMSWETFKAMPKDLRQNYIDTIQDRFGVGVSTISREMFGMSPSALGLYMERVDLKRNSANKGVKLTGASRDVWESWLAQTAPGDTCRQETAEEMPPAEETVEEIEQVCEEQEPFALNHVAVEFSGEFDPASFLRYISQFQMPRGRVHVRLEVTAE